MDKQDMELYIKTFIIGYLSAENDHNSIYTSDNVIKEKAINSFMKTHSVHNLYDFINNLIEIESDKNV